MESPSPWVFENRSDLERLVNSGWELGCAAQQPSLTLPGLNRCTLPGRILDSAAFGLPFSLQIVPAVRIACQSLAVHPWISRMDGRAFFQPSKEGWQ